MFSHSESKWAWLAGIIEGEGHLTIVARRGRRQPQLQRRLTITNGHLPLLIFIARTFGGKIYACPKVQGCKQSYQWYCYGTSMLTILAGVKPFLVGKFREAEIALSFEQVRETDKHKTGQPLTPLARSAYQHLLKEVRILRTRDYHPRFIPVEFASRQRPW